MPYEYSQEAKRYRDLKTGRFITEATTRDLRDQYVEAQRDGARQLARQLADGSLTLREWEAGMREHVKETFLAEQMLGRGGRNAMEAADFGSVGRQLRDQYAFLRGFAEDARLGTLSAAQIEARAQLYVNSATQAYERGRAAAFGVSLPAYPADGSAECRANDRCSWELVETEEQIEATWTLHPAEHCATCLERSQAWNPLVFVKSLTGQGATV